MFKCPTQNVGPFFPSWWKLFCSIWQLLCPLSRCRQRISRNKCILYIVHCTSLSLAVIKQLPPARANIQLIVSLNITFLLIHTIIYFFLYNTSFISSQSQLCMFPFPSSSSSLHVPLPLLLVYMVPFNPLLLVYMFPFPFSPYSLHVPLPFLSL